MNSEWGKKVEEALSKRVADWSRDGRFLLYRTQDAKTTDLPLIIALLIEFHQRVLDLIDFDMRQQTRQRVLMRRTVQFGKQLASDRN